MADNSPRAHVYFHALVSSDIADMHRLGLATMASQELELRQGQANDALEGLRLALGHKSLLFRTKVRVLLQGE